MHYFFFDAAGDSGFFLGKSPKGGGSKRFLVLCVISDASQYGIQDELKNLKISLGMRESQEIKFHTLEYTRREPFFKHFANYDFTGYVAVLDKLTSTRTMTLEKLKNGNKVTSRLLASLLINAVTPPDNQIINDFHLYVDEKKNNSVARNFIRKDVSDEMKTLGINYTFKLSPEDSKVQQSIQLADMVAGMVMDSYETGNQQFLKIIEHKLKIFEV